MASKRRLRRKACTGKVRYETAQAAQHAATAACRRAHAWIVAYGCRFCGGHHIGHPPKNVRQSIKARRERNGS